MLFARLSRIMPLQMAYTTWLPDVVEHLFGFDDLFFLLTKINKFREKKIKLKSNDSWRVQSIASKHLFDEEGGGEDLRDRSDRREGGKKRQRMGM